MQLNHNVRDDEFHGRGRSGNLIPEIGGAAAVIARALGHGCAPDPERAAECVSVRALDLLMRFIGAQHNDALAEDEEWRFCLSGWDFDPVRGELSHIDGEGSIEVVVSHGDIGLKFSRGGDFQLPFAEVRYGVEGWRVKPVRGRTDGGDYVVRLLAEKPDRIRLLDELDGSFGGAIVSAIRQSVEAADDDGHHVVRMEAVLSAIETLRAPMRFFG